MVEHKALLCILPFLCMCVNTYARPPHIFPYTTYIPHSPRTHHTTYTHLIHTRTCIPHHHTCSTRARPHIHILTHTIHTTPTYILPILHNRPPTTHMPHTHTTYTHTLPHTPYMPHHTHRPLTFSYMYTTPPTHIPHIP